MSEDRKIVVPGELLSEKPGKVVDNAYLKNGKAYSTVLGLYNGNEGLIRVTPLFKMYEPKPNDLVIGLVQDAKFAGYDIDLKTSTNSFLRMNEAEKDANYKIGDLVLARISDVDEVGSASLSNASKLYEGTLIEVNAAKMPRVLGSKQSMLNMLKEKTGCKILAGLNGRIWFKGENDWLVALAVKKIEDSAHLSGLTENISSFLDDELKKTQNAVKND